MLRKNSSFPYYLFSISNLIAAFGGGLILGKGVDVIQQPYLHGGSVLAFFIGTVLGLLFIQFIPKNLSKILAPLFSISCGITSIILFYLYQYNANAGQLVGVPALLFFILLSIRFGFWFYSRVMRASRASAHQRSVAWVEFGYYLGMVLGLTIWKLLGIHLELGMALIIDAFFQFLAGILDFKGMTLERHPVEQSKQNAPSIAPLQSTQCQSAWCWKLTGAVVFTTMGIQVVIFNTTHYVTEELSSYILATFYLGVAIAAFVCNKYKIYITWNSKNNLAMIVPHNTKKTVIFPLLFPMIISPLATILVIHSIYVTPLTQNHLFFNNLLICIFVFTAACLYEVLSISFLDRIGYEENKLNGSGMIMRTYGLMGLGAAVSFWTMNLIENHFANAMIVLGLSFFFATTMIIKRPQDSSLLSQPSNNINNQI